MQNVNDIISNVDEISLKHSFQDACSDNDFKAYAFNLNASEDTLMKYTSRLEEAFSECKNCIKCKGLDTCKNKVPGYAYTPIAKEKMIEFSYVICKYQQEEENKTGSGVGNDYNQNGWMGI